MQKVLVRQADALFQLRLVLPAQLFELGNVEELARRAVRLGRVPFDLALVTHDPRDEFGKGTDGEFLTTLFRQNIKEHDNGAEGRSFRSTGQHTSRRT